MNLSPEPQNPLPAPSARAHPVRDPVLTEVIDFSPLKGISVDEVKRKAPLAPEFHGMEERVSQLRAIITLTMKKMNQLNAGSKVIPLDRPEDIIEKLTRSSARVIGLFSDGTLGDVAEKGQLLGFARVFGASEEFPDRDLIPDDILEQDAIRFDRFFVADEARILDSRGGAADHLVGEIIQFAAGRTIIAKVLVGADDIDPNWLIAKRALEQRGFEDTHLADLEVFPHGDGRNIPAQFRWYLHPPRTDKGISLYESLREGIQSLARPAEVRLAHTIGHIPLDGGMVVCYSRDNDPWDLANLYRSKNIIGVRSFDSVRWKDERRPNLWTISTGIRDVILPPRKADSVIVFGALPDIAVSSDKNPLQNLHAFLENQRTALVAGGKIIIRDTFDPEQGNRSVVLHLSTEGPNGKSPQAVFEQFLKFAGDNPKIRHDIARVESLPSHDSQVSRYVVPMSLANEFQLKASYVKDIEWEAARPYTAYSLADVRSVVEQSGFRMLYAAPERNQWVYDHQRDGKIELKTLRGDTIPQLPTNFRLVAQRVDPSEAITIEPLGEAVESSDPQFLSVLVLKRLASNSFRNEGQIRSLIHRPGVTIDLAPFYVQDGRLHVVGRSFPRPIVAEAAGLPDESFRAPFLNEQIGIIVDDEALDDTKSIQAAAVSGITERTGISPSDIRGLEEPNWYLPSADISDEKVVVQPIEIDPEALPDVLKGQSISGFHSDGKPVAYGGERLLEACHAGGMSDTRLERAVYDLMLERNLSPGKWLGDPVSVPEVKGKFQERKVEEILRPEGALQFQMARDGSDKGTFFRVYERSYRETLSDGSEGNVVQREFAVSDPKRGFQEVVVPVLPLLRKDGELYAGIHRSPDMPGASLHGIAGEFPSVPLFNIPARISEMPSGEKMEAMLRFVEKRLESRWGVKLASIGSAGEPYFVSPGAMPKIAFPLFAVIDEVTDKESLLHFGREGDLLKNHQDVRCGYLRTLLYRSAHAEGLMG